MIIGLESPSIPGGPKISTMDNNYDTKCCNWLNCWAQCSSVVIQKPPDTLSWSPAGEQNCWVKKNADLFARNNYTEKKMNLWSVTLLLELLNKLWILCFLIYLSHLCYFNERLYFGRLTHWFLLEAVQGFRVRYKQFLRSYLTPLSGTTRHLIIFYFF